MSAGNTVSSQQASCSRRTAIARMAPVLGLAFIMAHFLRSVPAVIAPDLRTELALTPGQLSTLPAAIFLGAALMQLPVGVLLDRFGPRRTIAGFLIVAAFGTLLFAMAHDVASLATALFLIGCGAAPVFMGVIVLLSRWVARDRLATGTAIAISVGGGGMLLSSSPFAAAAELYGWRETLFAVGVIAFAIAIAAFLVIRDRPADVPPPHGSETLLETVLGLRRVLADTRLYSFAAATAVSVASLVTVRNLWIGPYLNDAFGLDIVARGHVIFVVSVAWLISALLYGPLDRWFDTRRGVVTGGMLTFAATAALLAVPLLSALGSPMLWALLPFMLATLAGLWWALSRSYATGTVTETLTFAPGSLSLTRTAPGQPTQHWQANPYWVTLRLHPTGGPVPNYLTLQGGAREVELGTFLTPQERATLHAELQAALSRTRTAPP